MGDTERIGSSGQGVEVGLTPSKIDVVVAKIKQVVDDAQREGNDQVSLSFKGIGYNLLGWEEADIQALQYTLRSLYPNAKYQLKFNKGIDTGYGGYQSADFNCLLGITIIFSPNRFNRFLNGLRK